MCIVGSGAGGSVVAATLQAAGLSVIVLERGGYRNESDFRQLEDVGARDLFMRGGDVLLQRRLARTSRGGDARRRHGDQLDGLSLSTSRDQERLDGERPRRARRARVRRAPSRRRRPDRRLDGGDPANRTSKLLASGIERFGLTWQTIARNACPDDDPRYCGYCHAGCQQGCKQSTLKTYLQDAADAGAQFVIVGCEWLPAMIYGAMDGRSVSFAEVAHSRTEVAPSSTVHSPAVVVAAGGDR